MCIRDRGGYEQIGNVNEAIVNWVQDNNYEFDGDMFSIYHVGPAETKNKDELVTEICFPIKKKQTNFLIISKLLNKNKLKSKTPHILWGVFIIKSYIFLKK